MNKRRITRLLIANRGEIACRIARTCKKLQIASIGIFSTADAQALHRLACDTAIPLPSDSYLAIDDIIAIALQERVDALHPGYGFLSENPEFAQKVRDAGILFVGPSASVISLMGNKEEARALATRVSVPTIPGVSLSQEGEAALNNLIAKEGFPLLVKASFGGGGRGMRRVNSREELEGALASASREAQAFFGNGSVFVERLIPSARHIEVQGLCDAHGKVWILGERDCTFQRSHQKVIEEAPAPELSLDKRQEIHEYARRLFTASTYENAGTAEFLLEPDGRVSFLEVNSRLQVEHPATEEIYKIDLVALQLSIAEGTPLGDEPLAQGASIECRICAEAPLEGFRPSTGTITWLNLSSTSSRAKVRFDTGYAQGSVLSHHYDSLLGKLIVHAATREEARQEAVHLLKNTFIAGIETNVSFLTRLLEEPAFHNASHSTRMIDEELLLQYKESHERAVHTACACLMLMELNLEGNSPWDTLLGWELQGGVSFHRMIECAHIICSCTAHIQGKEVTVEVKTLSLTSILTFSHIQVRSLQGALHCQAILQGELQSAEKRDAMVKTSQGVFSYSMLPVTSLKKGQNEEKGDTLLTAPLPGKIIDIKKKEGDEVAEQETIFIIESMKMEHHVRAPQKGKLTKISVKLHEVVGATALLGELNLAL